MISFCQKTKKIMKERRKRKTAKWKAASEITIHTAHICQSNKMNNKRKTSLNSPCSPPKLSRSLFSDDLNDCVVKETSIDAEAADGIHKRSGKKITNQKHVISIMGEGGEDDELLEVSSELGLSYKLASSPFSSLTSGSMKPTKIKIQSGGKNVQIIAPPSSRSSIAAGTRQKPTFWSKDEGEDVTNAQQGSGSLV